MIETVDPIALDDWQILCCEVNPWSVWNPLLVDQTLNQPTDGVSGWGAAGRKGKPISGVCVCWW